MYSKLTEKGLQQFFQCTFIKDNLTQNYTTLCRHTTILPTTCTPDDVCCNFHFAECPLL